LGGGLDTGRTVTDNCFVVDSPQQLVNCHQVNPFSGQTALKVFGVYQLPFDFLVSGSLQSNSGLPILATYTPTNAQVLPSLGRNLAAGAAGTAPGIPLIVPFTQFEARRNQLDVRLSKVFKLTSTVRLQGNLDAFNALNQTGFYSINTAYGTAWRRPTSL